MKVTRKMPKKIVIEISPDLSGNAGAKVKAVYADGTEVAFESAKSLQDVPKMNDPAGPPKFLDAMSITVVRTNPCGWVLINGRWYWKCW